MQECVSIFIFDIYVASMVDIIFQGFKIKNLVNSDLNRSKQGLMVCHIFHVIRRISYYPLTKFASKIVLAACELR